MAVDDDEIEHLGARIHFNAPARDLLLHRLIATALHLIPKPAERRRRRPAREAGSHHDHGIPTLVRGIHQLDLELMPIPFPLERTGRYARAQVSRRDHHRITPSRTATGTIENPSQTRSAKTGAMRRRIGCPAGLATPR